MMDGMPIPMIPMDSQDESDYRRLSPDDRHDFLHNLAVHYLTREDARAIIQRIRQTTKDQTGVRVLTHPQDFTQQTANVFALNFAKILSCFNVSTDRGENREWEVGNRSLYDDLDTRQSGTRLFIWLNELYLTLIFSMTTYLIMVPYVVEPFFNNLDE